MHENDESCDAYSVVAGEAEVKVEPPVFRTAEQERVYRKRSVRHSLEWAHLLAEIEFRHNRLILAVVSPMLRVKGNRKGYAKRADRLEMLAWLHNIKEWQPERYRRIVKDYDREK